MRTGVSPRLLLGAILAGIICLTIARNAVGRAAPPARPTGAAATPVVAARAHRGNMPVYLTGLGTVTALNTVTVRPQVDGQLVSVAFREGQEVRTGQLLAQIDPRPFQVQLEQAEALAAKDAATLANARVDLRRYQALIEQDAVPRQQLDTQQASVDQLEATVKSDQAQINSARLNLTYARVTSPIDGRIGLRLVDPGNIVHTTDQSGLAVITERRPIAVVFTIPQDRLPDVQQQLGAGRRLSVDAFDRELATQLGSGTLDAVDSQIDQTTGTVKLKALFANEHDSLFPNQFVNARLKIRDLTDVVLVPAAAIQRGPQKAFVYVVGRSNTVESRDVSVTMTEGDEAAIASGVADGEVVVTDGVERLQPGATVAVRFDDAPAQGGPR